MTRPTVLMDQMKMMLCVNSGNAHNATYQESGNVPTTSAATHLQCVMEGMTAVMDLTRSTVRTGTALWGGGNVLITNNVWVTMRCAMERTIAVMDPTSRSTVWTGNVSEKGGWSNALTTGSA